MLEVIVVDASSELIVVSVSEWGEIHPAKNEWVSKKWRLSSSQQEHMTYYFGWQRWKDLKFVCSFGPDGNISKDVKHRLFTVLGG